MDQSFVTNEGFEGFKLEKVKLDEATIRFRYGGTGSPIVLLHGHPRTHTTWYKVAPQLAEKYTVICPDLRGFGQSSIPKDTPDHKGSSKREKAKDCIQLMKNLGFSKFAIAGHDRGAYTAFRTAMDHPDVITHLAVLDGVPILEALRRCDENFAKAWWHWFFFGQADKPERAILADPDSWYAGTREKMGAMNYKDYYSAIHNPETVHGMVEDYRAGLGIDRAHDDEDWRQGRKIQCPVLCLWSIYDDLESLYGDVLSIWKNWAPNVRGYGIESGHHMAEEAPDQLSKALLQFLDT